MRIDPTTQAFMRSFDPFRLDVTNQCLWRGDTPIPLMPKPFAVLRYLVEHPGRLVTHDQLLGAIWPDTYVQPEVLRRYILEIRRALGDRAEAPKYVRTLPKRGYQFIAPVIEESATPAPAPVSVAANRLVGRSAALADLDGCLTRALDGRRQVVFVVGESGIGKTSLVDAFQHASAAISGVAVVRGQSVEGFGGKEAYYPLLEAIGQLARGPLRSVVVETLATYAPTWLIQLPSLVGPEQHDALQGELLGAGRERMVRELCEALEVLTQTVPLVLILEDLHWVDNSTLDIISAIARRREPARLLVLGTFRPADLILAASPLKALRQDLLLHHLTHEVELERLEESDVAEYLAAEFAPGDLPAGLAAIIHRHSDGNPLFMTAMLDHLVHQGVVSQAAGRWILTRPLEQVDPGVPETLRQMLETQLQDTNEAQQRLLTCASIVGQRFTAWAVATMLSDEAGRIEELCEGLVQRQQFLKVAGVRDFACGTTAIEYEFRHWLYRDVLYRRLNPGSRVGFHRRLAEGVESLGCAVQAETAAEIALHFEEGHEYERAVPYLLLTAKNAARRYAHGQAITILEHAGELLPRIAQPRREALNLRILEKMGTAHYALGEMDRAADLYTSMATRAADAGLLAEQAEALARVAHPAESIPFFLRAIELQPRFAGGTSRCHASTATSGKRSARRSMPGGRTNAGSSRASASGCRSPTNTITR